MSSQKEAVYSAVRAYMDEKKIAYEPNKPVNLSTEARKDICAILCAATVAGTVNLGGKAAADPEKYWPGCLSNWLRKDLRLNGGVEYVAKNPGSRSGSGDKLMRELKKLKELMVAKGNQKGVAEVEAEIAKRAKELEVEKLKKLEVQKDLIPKHLRKFVS